MLLSARRIPEPPSDVIYSTSFYLSGLFLAK
jgi:hypothetical protein